MTQLSVLPDLAVYGPESDREAVTRDEAFAYCRRLAESHYENFTVASWLLPRELRPHFSAVYAYCRWADDLADETHDAAQSLGWLDWWQAELSRCYAGHASHPVFVALRETIVEFQIPIRPFADLLTAFRQDQVQTRYATADEVLGYCRYSANPVGELVLYLGRCHDASRVALSDSICTGLQLANFCQDVARDWAAGRVYLPAASLTQAGYTEAMFERGVCNAAFRQVMAAEVSRAEDFLTRGQPLVRLMPSALQVDVALFVAGGMSIVQAIRQQDFDVWRRRPTVSRLAKLLLLGRCWWQTRGLRSR